MKNVPIAILSLLSLTTVVHGHPSGHSGNFVESTLHVVSQPDHLLGIGLSLVIAGLLIRTFLKKRKTKNS